MKIGNRTYEIIKSECWLVFPSRTLSLYVWTENDRTYLIIEPIKFENSQKLVDTHFQSDFKIESIDNIDSTLLENNNAIEILNQVVKFDSNRLFEIGRATINGKTSKDDIIKVNTETSLLGFEIWKVGDFQTQVMQIENILRENSIDFQKDDEQVNELIRIKIKS